MSRKYRQHGYMDRERESSGDGRRDRDRDRDRRGKRPKTHLPELRTPKMPGFHEVIRCSSCGSALPSVQFEITPQSHCPTCSADLHVCKNCVSFDTGSRFECREPIPQRVPRKDSNNSCTHFEARRAVERQTGSTPVVSVSDDPRAAFERLFKK